MNVPQEKRWGSIQSRLIQLLLLILIPVLAIQAYMYYDSYQLRRAEELQSNLEIARVLAKAFESFVQDVLHQELAIGLAITSSHPMTSKDITRLLETSRDYVAVRDFTWMNPEGEAIYSSSSSMIGYNYSDRDYFREVANGREWTVSELIIAKTTGKPAFTIARGFRDDKGALLGVIVAAILPEKLDARLAVERSQGGGYALVDNKGMLVYRYPAINTTWEERNWLKQYPEFGEALQGKEIATTVFAPYEGKNRLVGFTPVSSIGWAASAGKREEDVTWPILISIANNAFLFLFASFGAFFVAISVSRKITNPVSALHAHALALGNGEEPEQIRLNDKSEFQDLAETFNAMAQKVRARERALRESEGRYRVLVESAPDAVIVHRNGQFLYANAVALNLYGAGTLEQLQSRKVLDLIHPDERAAIAERMQQGQSGQPLGLRETMLMRTDGQVVPVESVGGMIEYQGSPAVQIIIRDITERKRAEEKLRESEDRFRRVFESNMLAMTFWHANGYLTDANKAFCDLIGYTQEEVRSGNVKWIDLTPPDILARDFQGMDEIKKTGVCTTYEKVFIHKDGHRVNILIGGAMIGDASDQGVAFIVDLTERKRLEEETQRLLTAVQAEKDRLSALINSMNDEVWLADTEGRFSLANPSGLHEFGIAVNDAIDVEKMAASLEVYRPDGTPRPIEETPPLRALKGEVVRNQEEIVRTPASDELRYREVNAAPVRDAEGNIIGSVSVVRDITERKRAEEQLRRNQRTLTELVERSPFGTYVVDSQFRIAIMNASSQEGAFCNVRPVIGRPFDEAMRTLWPEPVAAEIIGHFRHTLETGEPYYSPSFINPRHDKEIIESYEWQLHRMTLPDGQNGVICYYFDSTKLQEAQAALKEAKESLEQRVRERTMELQNLTEQLERGHQELRKLASELVMSEERERKRVAGVLHDEIAQTLAAARMRLDLLQSIPSDQKDKKTLQEVKNFLVQSIQEVRALMNDLGNPLLFDLGLKSACESLGNRLMEGHSIRISCDIRDEYKHLDPDMKAMLFQVIRELLNNVVKHSQAQNAHVRVDAESGQFRVKVTDDGVGFDSRMLRVPSGESGFGLYSIRERLTAMDGSLNIISAPGTGTVVTAILPKA